MNVPEIALSFAAGILIILLCAFLFSVKPKGLFGVAAASVAGGILLIVLSLVLPFSLPVSPFNAFITGLLGIPGVALIIFTVCFL